MRNHFGNGLKAGLKSTDICMAFMTGRFCSEYNKGYVLGYCYQIVKKPATENLPPGKRVG